MWSIARSAPKALFADRHLARLRVDPGLDAAVLVARLEGERVAGQAILEDDRRVGEHRLRLAVGPRRPRSSARRVCPCSRSSARRPGRRPWILPDLIRCDHAHDGHVAADILVADREDVDGYLHPGVGPRDRLGPIGVAGAAVGEDDHGLGRRLAEPVTSGLRARRPAACRNRSGPGSAPPAMQARRPPPRRPHPGARHGPAGLQEARVHRRQAAAEPEHADLGPGSAVAGRPASRIVSTTCSQRVAPLPIAMLCDVSRR